MKKLLFFITSLMILFSFSSSAFSQGKDKTFIVEDGVQMTAKVVKIDKKKRKVTLEGQSGKTKTVKIPLFNTI